MRPGRIVMLVLGTLSALLGLGLLAGAGAAGWGNYQQRDHGYFTTPSERYTANSYALTSPRLDLMAEGGLPEAGPVNVPGSILIRGAAADSAKAVFIGIAPQADAATYLAGVRHSEIIQVRFNPFRAVYRNVPGTVAPLRPADQSFWTASATGPGTQELKWDLRSGNWAVVIMNADATAPIAVDLQAGARSDLLWPIFIGLLIGGIVLLAIGVPLIVAGAAGLGRGTPPGPGRPGQPYGTQGYVQRQSHSIPGYGPPGSGGPPTGMQSGLPPGGQPPGGQPYGAQPYAGQPDSVQPHALGAPPGSGGAVYPARLNGYLDPQLSRGLWLVKWFLAIPHFIILFFLWFAFIVVTIVAGFAILFTARYPRSLFNFSVGVIRWNWRVAFYAYGVLGTDRYPPFTLARTDYPADFDVDYPERLSRGLVLVKSWLLAIPHLLIIGLLTGSVRTWAVRDGEWVQQGVGISLLGLLVFIAGVVLLFTGRYRQGLFDLLMGLHRWIYRVITYVALLRDEYPPFRLDMGPVDPGDVRAGPYLGPSGGPGVPVAATPPGRTPDTPVNAPPPVNAGPGDPAHGHNGFYGIGGPAASVGQESPGGAAGPDGPDISPGRGPGTPPGP